MSSWSARRKFLYTFIFIIVIGGTLGGLFYVFSYEKPTCFDKKLNGKETGIDCGGACAKVCPAELTAPRVSWARSFEVSPGSYNAVAYIDNPNIGAEAKKVPYTFRLLDEKNILVYERKGTIDIPRQTSFAVFEPNIKTGNRTPKYTFFEFTDTPNWKVAPGVVREEDSLRVKTQDMSTEDNLSKLSAIIENTSFTVIRDVELVAIIYDKSGNAKAVSRTVLDAVPAEGEAPAVFTWPLVLTDVSRSEIIPTVLR